MRSRRMVSSMVLWNGYGVNGIRPRSGWTILTYGTKLQKFSAQALSFLMCSGPYSNASSGDLTNSSWRIGVASLLWFGDHLLSLSTGLCQPTSEILMVHVSRRSSFFYPDYIIYQDFRNREYNLYKYSVHCRNSEDHI